MCAGKPDPMNKRNLITYAVAVAVFCALAVIALGLIDPTSQIWGGDLMDLYTQVNTLSWQARLLSTGIPAAIHSNELCFPEGGALFPADPIGGVLAAPLVWMAGPVAAYNGLVLANLIFACMTMFWLVHRRTQNLAAAFIAGIVYGLNPVVLGNVSAASAETLQVGWLPLFVGAMLALTDPVDGEARAIKTKRLVIAGALAWFFSTVASHWYHGLSAGLWFGLLALRGLVGADRKAAMKRCLTVGLIFGLLILPVLAVFFSMHDSGDAMTKSGSEDRGDQEMENSTDPAELLSLRPFSEMFDGGKSNRGYIGFVLPLAFIAGLIGAGAALRKSMLYWFAAGAFFTIFAIGPTLFFASNPVTIAGAEIPLPIYFLNRLSTIFTAMQFPYRFFINAYLALAVAIGLGWSALSARLSRNTGVALSLLLAVAIPLDFAAFSGSVPVQKTAIDVPGTIQELANDPGQFAVYNLPFDYKLHTLKHYVIGQAFHGRPMAHSGWLTGPCFSDTLKENALLNLLARAEAEDNGRFEVFQPFDYAFEVPCLFAERSFSDEAIEQALDQLREVGFGRFLIYREFLPPDSFVERVVAAVAGAPVAEDQQVAIYSIDDSQAPDVSARLRAALDKTFRGRPTERSAWLTGPCFPAALKQNLLLNLVVRAEAQDNNRAETSLPYDYASDVPCHPAGRPFSTEAIQQALAELRDAGFAHFRVYRNFLPPNSFAERLVAVVADAPISEDSKTAIYPIDGPLSPDAASRLLAVLVTQDFPGREIPPVEYAWDEASVAAVLDHRLPAGQTLGDAMSLQGRWIRWALGEQVAIGVWDIPDGDEEYLREHGAQLTEFRVMLEKPTRPPTTFTFAQSEDGAVAPVDRCAEIFLDAKAR
jgi:hypothetical protein